MHGSEVVVRVERLQACVVDQAEQKTLQRVEVHRSNEPLFIGEIVLASLSGALAAGSLLATSSQCQGNTPDAARTEADGLARFELPDLARRTANESQSATVAVEGGTPQHVSLSAR